MGINCALLVLLLVGILAIFAYGFDIVSTSPDMDEYKNDRLNGSVENGDLKYVEISQEDQNAERDKKIQKIRSNSRQRRSPNMYGGATYIRWGRSTCPDDPYIEQVYNGSAGSSFYKHDGAAAELICLPSHPMWGVFDAGTQGNAYVYGVEYRDNFRGFDKTNLNADSLSSNDVPCVLCRSSLRTTAIMIPAWNKCCTGWNLEYHGYLMAGHYSHKAATQYTCIDEAPEADPGGWKSEDGRYLYRVEPVCGALPCPRYVTGRELTCVVCSK